MEGSARRKRPAGEATQREASSNRDMECAAPFRDTRKGPLPGQVANRLRRKEIFSEQKRTKKADKRKRREERKEAAKAASKDQDGAPAAKLAPRTLENTRVLDETVVDPNDAEVANDVQSDELSAYFRGLPPKVLITTSNRPSTDTHAFAELLANVIPTGDYFRRRGFELKVIIKQAIENGFTDVVVVHEDGKTPTGLLVSHLPEGPTAHFKLTSLQLSDDIPNHGRATMHYPEVIINNFHTRLGQQVGRVLTALFPQAPEFEGRSVVTFHNQRDFIFFRRHRYIFRNKQKVGLQELGPRFTLKLRSLQKGTFDTKFGEYEFVSKPKQAAERRKFVL